MKPRNWTIVAFALAAASGGVHLVYLLAFCPFDLSPDEAHYWDWSRRPDVGYYSKGPLVAWLIAAGCELFGNTPFGVRVPAVACHVLLLCGLRNITAAAFGVRVACGAVAAAVTLPPVAAGAVLMTIDAPFLACWAWAAVFARRAAVEGRGGWAAAGVCVGLGTLAKYTMLLFPACVGLYLVFNGGGLRTRGFWRMNLAAAAGLLPLVLWNANHDWCGVRHVFRQAGGGGGFDVRGVFDAAAGQVAFLAGYWFCVVVAAAWAYRPVRPANASVTFLWWLCVPVLAGFLAAGIRTKVQPNWPAPGYVAGLALAAGWLSARLTGPRGAYRNLVIVCLAVGVTISTVLAVVSHFPGVLLPAFARFAAPPTADDPAPVRKLDPTVRLRGWRCLAAEVDRIRDEVSAADGRPPRVAAMVWTVPGELAFYCRGNPDVFTFGAALADRRSQYDEWRPNPVADAQAFAGETFVYVGEIAGELHEAFARVDPPVAVVYRENGVPVAGWKVWVCRGFRGFPDARHKRF